MIAETWQFRLKSGKIIPLLSNAKFLAVARSCSGSFLVVEGKYWQ
jgi:hypothetical protein